MRDYLIRRISPDEPYESLLTFPRYFEIETVNACNARCPMCTIQDWDRRDGLMDASLFAKIAGEISDHPEVKRVHLYRDGEPLLDKHLHDKVRIMKTLGVKRVGISTNVQLLTPIRAAALLEAGIDEIILSIDSLTPKVYEAIRVGCDFDTVMFNAANFILLRDKIRPECQIWVRMIRQESNQLEWPAYEKHWRSFLKATDRVDFRDLHGWGGQLKGAVPSSDNKPCVALWSLMVIFADGSIPLCNVDFHNTKPLGNVRDSTIAELWQSQTQQRRRELHMDGMKAALGICKGCDVWTERKS